jgi:hypothetical protein
LACLSVAGIVNTRAVSDVVGRLVQEAKPSATRAVNASDRPSITVGAL